MYILENGFRILMGLGAVIIISKRWVTIYYLMSRFTSTGSSTMHMLESPRWYKGTRLTFSDWVSLVSYRLFPNIRDCTEYKVKTIMVHPFGIWESDGIFKYLMKVLPITLLFLPVSIYTALGFWGDRLDDIMVLYFQIFLVVSVIGFVAKRVPKVSKILRFRFRYLSFTLWEVFTYYTFAVFSRERNITIRRLVLTDIIVCLLLFVIKYELLDVKWSG